MAKARKIFYGWWIVLVASVGLGLSSGSIILSTFTVFFKPLSEEFGWNRSQISLGFSLYIMMFGISAPITGRLIDRVRARKVIVPAVLIYGLGLIGFYFLSGPIWQFYALYLLIGIMASGAGSVAYLSVISHWFDKKRGLALGLVMAGYGTGASFIPSVAQRLISTMGWRETYVLLGIVVLAGTIPLIAFFLKETPQELGLLPDGAPAPEGSAGRIQGKKHGISVREAFTGRVFWKMGLSLFLVSACVQGALIHLVPMLTDRGLSVESAAFATSLFGVAVLVGRGVTGYLLDRIFAPYVSVFFFVGALLGIFLLWTGLGGTWGFAAAILVGLGLGAEGDIIAYLVNRYFGLRAFGEIYGYVFAMFVVGGIAGPLLMGVSFDSTGSYSTALIGFLVAMLLAIATMLRLGPYREWESSTGDLLENERERAA
jgi:sugar phosphate permease